MKLGLKLSTMEAGNVDGRLPRHQFSVHDLINMSIAVSLSVGFFILNYNAVRASAADPEQFFRTVSVIHQYQRIWLVLCAVPLILSLLVPKRQRRAFQAFGAIAFAALLYNVFLGLGTL